MGNMSGSIALAKEVAPMDNEIVREKRGGRRHKRKGHRK